MSSELTFPVIVSPQEKKGRPTRLALVLDPAHETPVRVWWHLDRPASRWYCSAHGPRRRATCPHMVSAYPAIRELLLGTEPRRG